MKHLVPPNFRDCSCFFDLSSETCAADTWLFSLAICSIKLNLLYNWLTDELTDTLQSDEQKGPFLLMGDV